MATDMAATAMDAATVALHSRPCPGCGYEPEITGYIRDAVTKVRRGYYCPCGAVVVDGIMVGSMPE